MNDLEISPSTEKGTIGIMHLKRYWEKSMAKRKGSVSQNAYVEEWNLDITLLCALGLGIEQTIKYLFQETPAFNEFEGWVLKINNGNISHATIENFNRGISGNNSEARFEIIENILGKEDVDHWNKNGYVIIRNAISKEDCDKTIEVICKFLGISIDVQDSWYYPHPARQGIMIQLFQDPQFEKNRGSEKIRAGFEQLWGSKDLWCNTDRISFNPPENKSWTFPGPRLHFDVSLELPIPFGLQGLLYLSDTKYNQGAFTLVPGFHNMIENWIKSLPPGADPRTEDLYKFSPIPIAANAGDFIIWHQALPHGSSPNTANLPRIVQYINYLPINGEIKKKWK